MSIKTRILQAERKAKPAQSVQTMPLERWERSIDALAAALGCTRDNALLWLKAVCKP